jgi:hypothetical protein
MPQNGRPSKYKPEYCEAIENFFDIEPWKEVEVTHKNKKGDEWTTYERQAVPMPTFHGFAKSIGVNGDTVVEWATGTDDKGNLRHPDFSAAYKRAKEFQKWFLIENGLNSLYNATFAIFTAKNITDMRDAQEMKLSGGINHTVDVTDEQYKTILEREASRLNGGSKQEPDKPQPNS